MVPFFHFFDRILEFAGNMIDDIALAFALVSTSYARHLDKEEK